MDLDGPIPLFPLPNVLLYPEAMLPLHVFEPRYVQMVEDMKAAGQDRMVLGLLETGWEDAYFEKPKVHPVAGLGKVLNVKSAPKGRYNLLVQGIRRVEVVEPVAECKNLRRAHEREVQRIEEQHQPLALEVAEIDLFELPVMDGVE